MPLCRIERIASLNNNNISCDRFISIFILPFDYCMQNHESIELVRDSGIWMGIVCRCVNQTIEFIIISNWFEAVDLSKW